jgi:VanZ family protein
VERLLNTLAPNVLAALTPDQLDRVDYNIRKTGHVTEYLILTLLAFRALQGGLPTPRGRVFAGAFGIAVGYAVTDELHQAFVPGRTPSPVDVLIDSGGATIALTLLAVFMGYKQIERRIRRLENEQKT